MKRDKPFKMRAAFGKPKLPVFFSFESPFLQRYFCKRQKNLQYQNFFGVSIEIFLEVWYSCITVENPQNMFGFQSVFWCFSQKKNGRFCIILSKIRRFVYADYWKRKGNYT